MVKPLEPIEFVHQANGRSVEIKIDLAKLAADLADRVLRSRTGRAIEMGGAVRARIVEGG